MKIKNRMMVAILNGIPEIKRKQLPIRIGFAINKNITTLDQIAKAYEEERVKIIDKYGKKDENGQIIKRDDGEYVLTDRKGYAEELNELLDIETDIQVHTVTLEEIEKCDTGKFDALTPYELDLLEFMIEE